MREILPCSQDSEKYYQSLKQLLSFGFHYFLPLRVKLNLSFFSFQVHYHLQFKWLDLIFYNFFLVLLSFFSLFLKNLDQIMKMQLIFVSNYFVFSFYGHYFPMIIAYSKGQAQGFVSLLYKYVSFLQHVTKDSHQEQFLNIVGHVGKILCFE